MRAFGGTILLFVLAASNCFGQSTAPAFPFTLYIHDSTGANSDTPLSSIYQFAATPLGSSSNVILKITNTSTSAAFLGFIGATVAAGSTVENTNFTVTNLLIGATMSAGDSLLFTVNFSPTTTGPITAYLEATYQIQQNGCDFTSGIPALQCPGGLYNFATINGTATQPQLVLTYTNSGGISTLLQPSASAPLSFGNVSTSASSTITFNLANESTVDINVPAITLPPPTVYTSSAFLLDVSRVPATLGAGESANFTVTFEPGQVGFDSGHLIIGSNTYGLQGAGIVVADIDALQISYVDSTGVTSLPEAATPISFGQVSGTTSSDSLVFTVTNPATSYNAVSLSAITVTGSAFKLGTITGASAFPASVAPGTSITFQVTFVPNGSGSYTGTLVIGTRTFSLAAVSTSSPLPEFTLEVNPSPLAGQEQATVAVQFATAASVNLVGTLTLAFTPSVAKVTDDPAIYFMATSGRTLNLTVASGSQNATYNGQSALSFQTGTTAGTIQFTVAFPDTTPYSRSFTITPLGPQITSATAVRSDPNLVVTLAGYDNTYSAGMLSFTFYDTSGKEIAPVSFDASSEFQQLFFHNNTGGGAFSVQATFPVNGNIADVGSVAVTATNSVGQASSTQTFH